MLEWQVTTGARSSAASGKEFVDGDRVVSVLVLTPDGGIERRDFLDAEEADAGEGKVLGRWRRVYRHDDSEQVRRRSALQNAEEVFLQLCGLGSGEEVPVEEGGNTAALRFLLALYLERKRVLRPLRGGSPGEQVYRHPGLDTEIRIATLALDDPALAALSETLEQLVA